MSTPKRTADTMSDAIALSSPNGRMSKRAKAAAVKRLGQALFGDGSCLKVETQQPSERERVLRQVAILRDLAQRGMRTKAYLREAERLEAEAAKVEA
jgi:hypothetical protein